MTNENKSYSVKDICLAGLFIAIVCVGTMFISLKVPATEGYIHFGDGFILIIAILFGKKFGAVAGGVGSALADILLGYPHWAVFTLIIKGLMGYVAGSIKDYDSENSKFFSLKNISAAFVAEIIMIAGYFIGGVILKGFFMTPDAATLEAVGVASAFDYGVMQSLSSVAENVIQGIGGIVVFDIIGFALHNAKIVRFAK